MSCNFIIPYLSFMAGYPKFSQWFYHTCVISKYAAKKKKKKKKIKRKSKIKFRILVSKNWKLFSFTAGWWKISNVYLIFKYGFILTPKTRPTSTRKRRWTYSEISLNRGSKCDVRVPIRWRLSLLLLWLSRWSATAELRGALRLACNWVRNVTHNEGYIKGVTLVYLKDYRGQ